MRFEAFDWRELSENVFTLVSKDWMLITASLAPGEEGRGVGDRPGGADWNTMTASWGGFGHLWNRDVAFVFVRPTAGGAGPISARRRFPGRGGASGNGSA